MIAATLNLWLVYSFVSLAVLSTVILFIVR